MIYLDNCSTTRPSEEVIKAMELALREEFANPSSSHKFGLNVRKHKEEVREEILKFLGDSAGEIIFTSGGTESNNMAIHSFIEKNAHLGKRVITTSIEHASVLSTLHSYPEIEVIELPVDKEGKINREDLLNAVNENTIMVSLYHVHSELGTINPVEDYIREIKQINPETLVHIDGIQAVGKIPVDVKRIGCDSYSFSAHKFHGPKGIGGLYLKQGLKIKPLIYGGSQEGSLRSGTENTPGIYGMGAAFKYLLTHCQEDGERVQRLREYCIENLNTIGDLRINSPSESSPYILSVSIKDTRGEVILNMLAEKEIYISTTSACSSNTQKKSKILMNMDPDYRDGTFRLCLSNDTTKGEIDSFIAALKEAVQEIRALTRR